MKRPVIDRYIAEALKDNEYLRGDDCQSTRNYLLGWVGSLFRRGEGRKVGIEEEAYILEQIEAFVKAEIDDVQRKIAECAEGYEPLPPQDRDEEV
ncbi:MAG: hypothetical protein Q7S02_06555 [bacterium]|nr:hypothetical protein [bacterium]